MPVYDKKPNPINITGNLLKINFSIDDFKRIRKGNFLYIDKTKMIEDILSYDEEAVLLFTRPRRFGKSLNLSMLRYFFDMTEDSAELFKGLYIEQSKFYKTHLNQYPVLYLNFKDVSTMNIDDVQEKVIFIFKRLIQELYQLYQFEELLDISIETNTGNINTLGIKEITRILSKRTQKNVIVLIDEYDSLINQAYGTEIWLDLTKIIKGIFGTLLKSNEYLEMGVLTGVSKIGKELGFSDMNNLSVHGLTKSFYYEYFGFTESEVKELLMLNQIEMVQDIYEMYNGYQFEESPFMFNTASILKFLDDYYKSGKMKLAPYWINFNLNNILKDNISKQDLSFKDKLLGLLDGSTIMESIYESINYENLDETAYMFSLLIDTGYLCPVENIDGTTYKIKIPNKEVLYGYKEMISMIIGIDNNILGNLCEKLIKPDIASFEKILNDILLRVSSFHDFSEKENSYHNLLLGALLFLLGKFKIRSNREAGLGRYDIALIPNEKAKELYKPIIIEFKVPKESVRDKEYTDDELLALAETAITQINEKKYYAEYADMYTNSSSAKFADDEFIIIGIAAQGKRCRVCVDLSKVQNISFH